MITFDLQGYFFVHTPLSFLAGDMGFTRELNK